MIDDLKRPACKAIRRKRAAHRGQNLVELVLTLPFILIFLFFIIDVGRAWMVYEGAKMAARDAAYTAAIYHNASVGQTQLSNKLLAGGMNGSGTVKQVPNQHAYQVNVQVRFTPLFAQLTIPTLSGPQKILPASFPVSFTAVTDVSVY